jgi:hypothetical protein
MSANRPLYETRANLEQEAQVAAVIARKWNCVPIKLPIKYSLDYAMTRGQTIVSFCEFKTRSKTMAEIASLGGYLINLDKWMNAQHMSKATGLPFTLVVQTRDKKIWYSVFKDDFSVLTSLYRGRTDRNDSQDISPCVLISTDVFKLLEETSA